MGITAPYFLELSWGWKDNVYDRHGTVPDICDALVAPLTALYPEIRLSAMEIVNVCPGPRRHPAYIFTMSMTVSITKQIWSQLLKLFMFITPSLHLSSNKSEANACLKAINNASRLETKLQKEQKQSKRICSEIFKCTFFLFVFCYKKHSP